MKKWKRVGGRRNKGGNVGKGRKRGAETRGRRREGKGLGSGDLRKRTIKRQGTKAGQCSRSRKT